MADNRLPVTVRLAPDDKALWDSACRADGIEPSVALRQVAELMLHRLRAGDGFIEALALVKAGLKPTVRVQARTSP